MRLSHTVQKILKDYQAESPAVKSNLVRILMNGKLSGTGKMVILPVDQGFEHGPDKSFIKNPLGYDPHYHIKLALDAGLNAYAAPKGMLEAVPDELRGTIPLILKANSSNALTRNTIEPKQSMTASIKDAIHLGCTALGFTIYPGSDDSTHMIQEISEMILEAKSYGFVTIVWAYPRGGGLDHNNQHALDIISYATHIAALIGASIIKVKIPSEQIKDRSLISECRNQLYDYKKIKNRISHVVKAAFSGRRLVVFSGGATKVESDIYRDVIAINKGGGSGSMVGRNSFQRPYKEAKKLLSNIIQIYLKESNKTFSI